MQNFYDKNYLKTTEERKTPRKKIPECKDAAF